MRKQGRNSVSHFTRLHSDHRDGKGHCRQRRRLNVRTTLSAERQLILFQSRARRHQQSPHHDSHGLPRRRQVHAAPVSLCRSPLSDPAYFGAIRHILTNQHGLRIAVILNEFGDSNDIEGHSVVQPSIDSITHPSQLRSEVHQNIPRRQLDGGVAAALEWLFVLLRPRYRPPRHSESHRAQAKGQRDRRPRRRIRFDRSRNYRSRRSCPYYERFLERIDARTRSVRRALAPAINFAVLSRLHCEDSSPNGTDVVLDAVVTVVDAVGIEQVSRGAGYANITSTSLTPRFQQMSEIRADGDYNEAQRSVLLLTPA